MSRVYQAFFFASLRLCVFAGTRLVTGCQFVLNELGSRKVAKTQRRKDAKKTQDPRPKTKDHGRHLVQLPNLFDHLLDIQTLHIIHLSADLHQ